MEQDVIIAILFVAALVYLGFLIFKNFRSTSCASGCGSCGIDFSKIQKAAQKRAFK